MEKKAAGSAAGNTNPSAARKAANPAAPRPASAAGRTAPVKSEGGAKAPVRKPSGAKSGKPAAGGQGKPAGRTPGKKPVKKSGKKRRALRRKRIRLLAMIGGGLAAVLLAVFFLTTAVIGGKVYPLSTEQIDLRGRGLTDARSVARLTGLTEARLSDNAISDASPLAELTGCAYIDLTGNPVTPESYAYLKAALPSCLILCEAQDNSTETLALGGYDLPDAEALSRVFLSHSALRSVDLRAAELSEAEISLFSQRFPHIRFIASAEGASNTLPVSAASAQSAAEAIGGLPGAVHVTVIGYAFSPEEYCALKAQFPEKTLDCLIALGGAEYSLSEKRIDLSGLAAEKVSADDLRLFENLSSLTLSEALPSQAAHFKAALGLEEIVYHFEGESVSPELTEIDLRGASGLNAVELEALMNTLPGVQTVHMDEPDESMMPVIRAFKDRVRFIYEVSAFGKTFSSETESIDFGGEMTDADAEELLRLIEHLPYLKEALMYESELSQKSMDTLFDGCPDVFFGWTFSMCSGRYVVRSDATAFSTMLGKPRNVYTQQDFYPLRYCKNLMALDLGHNAITDLSFLEAFPKMRVLILADNRITDLTPVASLGELEYLELFMNYDLTDYSPLAGLPLIDLNLRCEGNERHTLRAEQLTELTTLQRLWLSEGHLSEEEEEMLRAALPDCQISMTESHSTGNGWRKHDRYEVVERIFEKGQYEAFE